MTESESPPSTPADSLSELLQNPYRRAAVAYLAERRAPVGLYALAGQLIESIDSTPADRAPDDVEAMAVALHHNHLPRLADHGLLEYDVERRTVLVPREAVRTGARPDRPESAQRRRVAPLRRLGRPRPVTDGTLDGAPRPPRHREPDDDRS